ncbi:uncharacterized protein LOC131937875 isoform X3 [Physella acuta]|uniref:uncharacterized protein LOC131937875 isoform X3 n=1 Tax=Physella acuta TaxID=109671 RepID=UPI0027DDA383|nr:uncharacterized protein LOC131937875 isoform X3 [Physella acuta]
MALITVALAFLGVWSISAQVLHKSIVPKIIKRGSEVTVFCDPDLAGVPENDRSEGIFALKLSWNEKFAYSFSTRFGTGITIGVNTHWRTRVSGHYPKNSHGLFYRDTVRLELDMINVKHDDQGEFCCSSYICKNGELQRPTTKRCEDFIVSHHSIVEASLVAQDPTLKMIHCTADLAGVPDTATEIDRMELFWQNKDFDPNSYLKYTLTTYWYSQRYPDLNSIRPNGKNHWRLHRAYEDLKPNKRLTKDATKLAIIIYGLQAQDAGWYCCSVNYFDKDDVNRLAHRCHYLSDSRIQAIKHSRNGSSIKRVTENLILGLLMFSWIQQHIYRG